MIGGNLHARRGRRRRVPGAARRLPMAAGSAVLLLALLQPGCARERPSRQPLLAELDTIAKLGVLAGDSIQELGRIAAVVRDSAGHLFVLDSRTPALLQYTADGVYVGAVRGRGGGPGELAGPSALALDPTGRLLVMDPRNGRILVYAPSDHGPRYLSEVRPELVSRSLCTIGARWYLQAPGGRGVIHELSPAGGVVRSFGEPVDLAPFFSGPAPPLIQETFGLGPMLCTAAPDLIVALATAVPVVRAFAPDGQLVWNHQLADYHPLELEQSARGMRGRPAPGTGSQVALGMTRWAGDTLLVQLEVRHQEAGADSTPMDIDSRFLSLKTGEELGRTRSLPRIAIRQGDTLYAFRNDPFPQVLILGRSR